MAPTGLARFRKFFPLSAGLGDQTVWFGWSMALLSTISFSIASPIIKGTISGGMDPTAFLVSRLALSALIMGGAMAITAPQSLRIDRRGLLIAGLAGLGNGFGMFSFFWSLTLINASVAAMIFALSPLAVLSLLALRGEKFTRRNWVRIGLGLAGVYLLLGPGGAVNWVGVGLVCLAIMTYAVHLTLLQWFLQNYDARTITFYVIVGMGITSAGFWIAEGAEWQDPGPSGWLAIVVLAVVCTYIARLTMFTGIRHLGSGQIALLAPTETLLTVFWSVLFLQERLSFWEMMGGILILTSALLAIKRLNRARWRPRWRFWSRV